jgi:hypothetical protein
VQLLDVGPRGYTFSIAAATKAYTPLYDRAAKVTDVRITNPSATDQWTFSVGGKELFRGYVYASGYQNPFGNLVTLGVDNRGWIPYISDLLGMDISIPVPNGQTLTIASVGGATADIAIEYKECSISDIQSSMINHYQGNRTIHPVVQYLGAAATAVGPVPLDTQIASPWIPKMLHGNPIPPDWKINLIALWAQPFSINTYSGAANHVYGSQGLQIIRNGQVQLTRDNTGLPDIAQAAAAGSANSVILPRTQRLNPFQLMPIENNQYLDPMITLQDGDNFEIDLLMAGDFTGAAVSTLPMVLLLADVTQVNP